MTGPVSTTLSIPLLIGYPNTGPPYFSPPLPDVTVILNQAFIYRFTDLVDDDSLDVGKVISLDLSNAGGFTLGSYPTLTFRPTKPSEVGSYTISVKVADDNLNSQSALYSFYLTVQDSSTSLHVDAIASTNATKTDTSNNQTEVINNSNEL